MHYSYFLLPLCVDIDTEIIPLVRDKTSLGILRGISINATPQKYAVWQQSSLTLNKKYYETWPLPGSNWDLSTVLRSTSNTRTPL